MVIQIAGNSDSAHRPTVSGVRFDANTSAPRDVEAARGFEMRNNIRKDGPKETLRIALNPLHADRHSDEELLTESAS